MIKQARHKHSHMENPPHRMVGDTVNNKRKRDHACKQPFTQISEHFAHSGAALNISLCTTYSGLKYDGQAACQGMLEFDGYEFPQILS
jgi:hypothetical protein